MLDVERANRDRGAIRTMATNYTVVLFSRQHIGNDPGVFNDVEPNVVFVGRAKDFPFDCPGVNSAEAAFLMFQSRDVDHQRNVLRVNGEDVFGGLPASPARDAWNGNILLVERHHQLKAAGNVLRVEARTSDGGSAGDVDDFILDNVVTRRSLRPGSWRRSPTCVDQGPERMPPISATNMSCLRRPSSSPGARCSGASSQGRGITRTHKSG